MAWQATAAEGVIPYLNPCRARWWPQDRSGGHQRAELPGEPHRRAV